MTSPEREPIDEAIYFHRKLKAARMAFGGGIVNRVHADQLGDEDPGELAARLVAEAGLSGPLARRVADCFADEHALARRDRDNVAHLAERLGASVPLLLVPHLDDDVHDAGGLVAVGAHLFA